MLKIIVLFLALVQPAIALASGNEVNDSFARAKRWLGEIYSDHRETVYCGAGFHAGGAVDLPPGFVVSSHPGRAGKIEWEHAVPAENFGRAFSEWREGDPSCVHRGKPFKGRACAEKANMRYRFMQADMHNLFPAIGAVNAARKNYAYAELPGAEPKFCGARIEGKRFEPPERARGVVARASLYMDEAYPEYRLSSRQRRLFKAWDRLYPPDAWECEREGRVANIQKNSNRFVRERCG